MYHSSVISVVEDRGEKSLDDLQLNSNIRDISLESFCDRIDDAMHQRLSWSISSHSRDYRIRWRYWSWRINEILIGNEFSEAINCG